MEGGDSHVLDKSHSYLHLFISLPCESLVAFVGGHKTCGGECKKWAWMYKWGTQGLETIRHGKEAGYHHLKLVHQHDIIEIA